ncbi:unnamed protein product [Phaedon cochleariae]|uniref:Myb/SANT-like DNA-binding domain-containing protein n=1 Tax=Phaedon cochleariae TaxID=80249 RepID=A0A9N9X6K6_PHACE|nr:unnamed protein product [Phaedon cochleariae]
MVQQALSAAFENDWLCYVCVLNWNNFKMDEKTKKLQLNDVEMDKIYEVYVSNDDYDRALKDNHFANALLMHARGTAEDISSDVEEMESENTQCATPCNSQTQVRTTNIWSFNQTQSLINSMASYYADFNDVRKRKHIFEHIANDLISAGYAVDAKLVQNKWKSLLRSYTKAKDTKTRTGQGPSRFLFYELIDDIVGNHPKNKCDHSLNTLDPPISENDSSNGEKVPLEDEDASERQGEQERDLGGTEELNTGECSAPNKQKSGDSVSTEGKENGECSAPNKKIRLSEKQLKKEFINSKKIEYAKRQKRHDEKLAIETKRMEIEEKKLAVLQEYLKNKQNPPKNDKCHSSLYFMSQCFLFSI